jgi:hypothetical protein
MSRKRSCRPWTSQELDQVEELRGQGRTYPEIAALLGRTVRSVSSQGWLYRYWRRSRLGEWLRVLKKPHSLAGAAAEMGTGVAGARSAVRRLRAEGYKIRRGNGSRRSVSRSPEPAVSAGTVPEVVGGPVVY